MTPERSKLSIFQHVAISGLFVFLMVTLSGFHTAAYADGTFLLQLGSYDSESEASQKWKELKTKNTDVLGKLTLHVAEVAMPPENKVSYRTQAGPVASREEASAMCNTLQNRGVDCYVVETALFTGESLPQPQASDNAAPIPAASVSEMPATAAAAAPATPAPAPVAAEPARSPTTVDPATSSAVPPPVLTSTLVPMTADNASVSAPSGEAAVASADAPPLPALPPTDHIVPGREPKFLALPASMAPAPVQVAAVETSTAEAPAPTAPSSAAPAQKPGFFSRLFGASPEPASGGSTVANVNVAEAIRVPLSDDKSQSAGSSRKAPIVTLAGIHGLGGTPSSDTSKAYWAQLSYFHDEYEARSFYQDFHAAYPQFSNGVRVRITRPYSYVTTPGHVSLRIGPFLGIAEIHAVCVSAASYHLRCTVVRDLGSTTAYGVASSFMPTRPFASFPSAGQPGSLDRPSQYWVQLGSYHSHEEAMQMWKTLSASHKRSLRRVRFSVTSPTLGSAQVTIYRLHAGPFTSETGADKLCRSLKSIESDCVVLSDR